jgi:hypothetical protein
MQETPNLNYVKELAGDDIDFERRFITIIQNEFPIEKNAYLNHMQNKEPSAASEIVHKLKHKFNILGMEAAYKFAVAYEGQLSAGNMGMDMEFRSILIKIETYLKTI